MHTVRSFHSSTIAPDQVSAVMAGYLALERARIYRRLLVTRFALLAIILAIAGFGFQWMPLYGSWLTLGLCFVAPLWAWVAELKCGRRLARQLERLPDSSTHVVMPPRA